MRKQSHGSNQQQPAFPGTSFLSFPGKDLPLRPLVQDGIISLCSSPGNMSIVMPLPIGCGCSWATIRLLLTVLE